MNNDSFDWYRGVCQMRARTLRRLHAELSRAWSSGLLVDLARTGTREFQLLNMGIQPTGFVFNRGWMPGAVHRSLSSLPSRARAKNRVLIWCGVIVLCVLGIGLTTLQPGDIDRGSSKQASAANSLANGNHSRKLKVTNPTSDADSTCALIAAVKSPVKPGGETLGDTRVTITRDVIIGGERQQEVAVTCIDGPAKTIRRYALRFWLEGGSWKAKSATPMGSHSRLG